MIGKFIEVLMLKLIKIQTLAEVLLFPKIVNYEILDLSFL